jgi:RNA polymerase sigma-70 factor, ECF subfamily
MEHEAIKADFLDAYDLYADEILRFCFFKISDYERAQDLTQEVFTRFWQELRKGVSVQNTRAFLYTIARTSIIDWYRKKKPISLEELSDQGVQIQGTSGSEIQDTAQYNEILSCIDTLDEKSKEIVLLRYVEGLSIQDISRDTGESSNVLSVRLNRAIKKIQMLLQSLDT